MEGRARELAQADVSSVFDDDLGAVALERAVSLLEAAKAHVGAELEARQSCDREHGLRTGAWVAREAGTAPAATRLRVRVRVVVRQWPVIDAAWAAGALSWEHVRVLVCASNPRVIDAIGGIQDSIVALAAGCGFGQWQGDVRALIALVDQDGPEPRDGDGSNRLGWKTTMDGVLDVQGRFTYDLGLALRTAVDRKADELFRRYTRDRETFPELVVPGRAELSALALIELLRVAVGADTKPARPEVTLVKHRGKLTGADGHPVGGELAGVWGCVGDVTEVTVNDAGVPLAVGHTYRLATAAQRRALAIRDGGCTFAGCDLGINWCDAHHVIAWDDGGPTDLASLALGCRRHHGVAHRRGWSMGLTDDGWTWWTSPSGISRWGQRHFRRRTGPTPDQAGYRPGIIHLAPDPRARPGDENDTGGATDPLADTG